MKRIEWGYPLYGVRWCRKLIDQDSINMGKGALYKAAMWDYATNSLYVVLQYYYQIYPGFGNYFLKFTINGFKNEFFFQN